MENKSKKKSANEINNDSNIIKENIINNLNINDTKEEENYKFSTKSLNNTREELNNVPMIIQNYLKENNCAIVTFKNMESFQIIKCGYLKKSDATRSKIFFFQFNEEHLFYFFITKEENPNYLKPKISKSNQTNLSKLKIGKTEIDSKIEESNQNNINLNYDYNRYILKAVTLKISNEQKIEVFKIEILDREVCQVSNSTLDSINYNISSKIVKPEKAYENFEKFNLMLDKYYIIEIETRKPATETIIKEDGILSVLYLLTPRKQVIINLFTMVKYALYFIKETLYNYIGKYIHDMIYDFCHLPSDCLSDFLSHIGCLTERKNGSYNLVFPLKKYIKTLKILSNKNLINHIYRNLPNIAKQKAADRIPFHKFIFLMEKYKQYYATKEYKIKQKYLNLNSKKYCFLQPSLIYDKINDKITKEHRININNVLKTFFEILEIFFNENFTNDKKVITNFMIQNLSKFLTQYTSLKGFFNLDIIINEDNMFEFRCTNNKEFNKKINNNMFGCVVGFLGCINYIFGFNEGFFHKHITIMEYSFNFNEKNVVHTFLSCNDSSKKNKVRIFDIPFMEKWNYQIAGLLLYLYKEMFGFLNDNKIQNNNQEVGGFINNSYKHFDNLLAEINKNISDELFKYYENVLPDYYEFCKYISNSPLDKYNCLDNLCQNFANNSIELLLKNNIIFFSPFETVFDINQKHLLNMPNLNSVLEPYLIMVDQKFKLFLEKKEKKDQYLDELNLDEKAYFKELKSINVEKVHYSVFIKQEQKEKEIEENEEEEFEENENKDKEIINDNNNIITTTGEKEQNLDININENKSNNKIYPSKMYKKIFKKSNYILDNKLFDYYFFFNLYFYFTYKITKELKHYFSDYDIIKRYIASLQSSIIVSFNESDRTIIKNTKQNYGDFKTIKKIQKKNLIKDLIILDKLTNLTRHMNYIFNEYMNGVIQDIIKDKTSHIAYRNSLGEKHYIKIGHYIIDFLAYEKNGIDFNSFQYFKTSKIYKKLFGENDLGNGDNIIKTNL